MLWDYFRVVSPCFNNDTVLCKYYVDHSAWGTKLQTASIKIADRRRRGIFVIGANNSPIFGTYAGGCNNTLMKTPYIDITEGNNFSQMIREKLENTSWRYSPSLSIKKQCQWILHHIQHTCYLVRLPRICYHMNHK